MNFTGRELPSRTETADVIKREQTSSRLYMSSMILHWPVKMKTKKSNSRWEKFAEEVDAIV